MQQFHNGVTEHHNNSNKTTTTMPVIFNGKNNGKNTINTAKERRPGQ